MSVELAVGDLVWVKVVPYLLRAEARVAGLGPIGAEVIYTGRLEWIGTTGFVGRAHWRELAESVHGGPRWEATAEHMRAWAAGEESHEHEADVDHEQAQP